MTRIGNFIDRIKTAKKVLTGEEAEPNIFGIRQAWNASQIASALQPESLAALVTSALSGDAHDYLTLAEEMEEKDLHYRSVMGTRKHAIEALEPTISPADDDEQRSLNIAEDVKKTIIDAPHFNRLIKDALDALGKGYSVNEIIWETTESQWVPKEFKFRDPRWFEYDRVTGRRLLLRHLSGIQELSPYKYIIHEPHLKSGLPLRGGLALPVAFYFLIKNYDLAGWAAFVEVFGYPIRLGRYDGRADSKDIEVLRRAIKNIGRDVGAIVPKGMEIEILNGVQGRGNIDLFERLGNWIDKQISKGVLGQTMSTDAEGGQYKGDLHNEVRQEIRESDATQLATTLNRDLIRPYVELNYGVQDSYPVLNLPVPRPENIPDLVEALEKLVPLGFKVKSDEMYRKLGLTRPDEKDDILIPPVPPTSSEQIQNNTELNREDIGGDDELEDWIAVAGPVRDALNKAATECESFDEMLKKLPSLVGNLATENTAGKIASATLKARALGDKEAFE